MTSPGEMLPRAAARWITSPRAHGLVTAVVLAVCAVSAAAAPQPWTTSLVTGTPEPPPPLQARKVYEHVRFTAATALAFAPDSDRCFVTELYGKVYSLPADRDCRQADLFLDAGDLVSRLNAKRSAEEALKLGGVFHLAFHPAFATNRFCYLCYTVGFRDESRQPAPDGTRVV